MKIFLKGIKHYFLTVDTNGTRKKHMVDEFGEYDLVEVNPVLGIGREKSGASGFCRIIDLALRNQDRTKPFVPFAIYEDDCSKYREYPEYIEIPDDADICYIGLSMCSMNDHEYHVKNYYTHIDNEVVRVYNMLSTHGMMICSASGALAIQKAVLEGYYKNTVWDIFIARMQPYYNVYALKKPLVFQDKKYNGQEDWTRFSIESCNDSPLPEKYINTTNDSVITCYK
jgi:hypothetical protein